MEVNENDRDDEDIDERDFKKEKPAQAHQLVPPETRQSPAHPHEQKDQCGNLGEEDRDVDQTENPTIRAIRNPGKMPAPKKERNNDARARDHGDVFAEEKQTEFHCRIFGVVATGKFLFSFRQIERESVRLREDSYHEDEEGNEHRNSEQPLPEVRPVADEGRDQPAVVDLILDDTR